ncbi:MAG: diaminopimelate decarboxylase, partial [Candidatus Omnitrophica bacterium]|nr:diaminopimelate decarboxylase [Candidatus Omnitrophota bacterium]
TPGRFRNLRIQGIHIHIGSQITEPAPFIGAIKRILNFIDSAGISIEWLNIGGGLGIVYSDEKPQTAAQFAKKILPYFKGRRFKLILEPGRFIAGNSGILVTQVLYIKDNPSGKRFAIVDAGMNDLIRPALYGAYHEILPVKRCTIYDIRNTTEGSPELRRGTKYDIVGPICESGDFLAQNRKLPGLKSGDLLAVMGAGAYGFTMASNYNSRPRTAEIMVVKGKAHIVKKAETYGDLVRGEIIPKGL